MEQVDRRRQIVAQFRTIWIPRFLTSVVVSNLSVLGVLYEIGHGQIEWRLFWWVAGIIVLLALWYELASANEKLTNQAWQAEVSQDLATIKQNTQKASTASGLRKELLDLSSEILEFHATRKAAADALGSIWVFSPTQHGQVAPDTFTANAQVRSAQRTQSMGEFSKSFAARALALYRRAKDQGVVDDELEVRINQPTNLLGVRFIGERLGALADRVTE